MRFNIARACWRIKRLATLKRDDTLLARIDPPLRGAIRNLEKAGQDVVLIAAKSRGQSVFPVTDWPLAVHIGIVLISDPEMRDTLDEGDFKSVAWGELYRTREDARRSVGVWL